MVELESICGNQRDSFDIHSIGYVSKKGQRVSVTSSPNDCRRPKPRPDLDHGEDPDRLLLSANECANLSGSAVGTASQQATDQSNFGEIGFPKINLLILKEIDSSRSPNIGAED